MGSKELANELHMLKRRRAPGAHEKKLLDICNKINVKPRVIREWLEAISISPEIQETEIKKPKEEKIAGTTLARLSTIEDEELQKKVYAKIVEQDMGKKTASRFITNIKKVDKEKQETFLTPGVVPVIDVPSEKQEPVVVPKEEIERLRKAIEEDRKKWEEYYKSPYGQEQARLFSSWVAHVTINFDKLTCPVCGNDYTHLIWTCHNINVRDAGDRLREILEERSRERGKKRRQEEKEKQEGET